MHIPTEFTTIAYNDSLYTLAYKLHRSSTGQEALVFLPGIGCIKECFDEAFSADSLKDYSILTFDFLGFGESAKSHNFSYTLEDHAAITKLLIQELQLQNICIIGHSMGAGIGLLLAQELPITNFINLEGALVGEDISAGARSVTTQSEEAFVDKGFDSFVQPLIASGRKDLTTWATWLETADRVAIYRSMRSMAAWPDDPKLLHYFNDLPKKSYIYGAERSKDYLLSQLVNTSVYRMGNCGHFMMLDEPNAFYKLLSETVHGVA